MHIAIVEHMQVNNMPTFIVINKVCAKCDSSYKFSHAQFLVLVQSIGVKS